VIKIDGIPGEGGFGTVYRVRRPLGLQANVHLQRRMFIYRTAAHHESVCGQHQWEFCYVVVSCLHQVTCL
jgi:hypothetical protein